MHIPGPYIIIRTQAHWLLRLTAVGVGHHAAARSRHSVTKSSVVVYHLPAGPAFRVAGECSRFGS